jgi:hypothetical protein
VNFFFDLIDDVCIYDVALIVEEIEALVRYQRFCMVYEVAGNSKHNRT